MEQLQEWVEEDKVKEVKAMWQADPVTLLISDTRVRCNGVDSRHLLPPDFDFDKSELCKSKWVPVPRSASVMNAKIRCKHCGLLFNMTWADMIDQQTNKK